MNGLAGLRIAVLIGLFIGVLLILVFLKVTKTDGDVKLKYDERQDAVRGKGFKYGFYTAIGWLGLDMILKALEIDMTMFEDIFSMVGVLVSLIVYVVYAIFNDAYFSLNENFRRVIGVFIFITIFNFAIGISNFATGQAFVNGKFTVNAINLFCGFAFVVIFVAIIIKNMIDKTGDKYNEES